MEYTELLEKYYTKTLKYLSFRPRSEKEIRDYLTRKKADEKMIEVIVKTLHQQKFIDDSEFAKMWVQSRTHFKPKSKRIIKMELKQKGISEDLIEQTVDENLDEQVTDEALAHKIVEQKITRYKNLDKEQLFKKLAGQLGRRGFDWDTIKKVLKDYL